MNPESPYRHAQSLPRSAGSSSANQGLRVHVPNAAHANLSLPPRAASFHQKSRSTGGLGESGNPLKERKISLDNIRGSVEVNDEEENLNRESSSSDSSKTETRNSKNSDGSKSSQVSRRLRLNQNEPPTQSGISYPKLSSSSSTLPSNLNTSTQRLESVSIIVQSDSESENDSERLEIPSDKEEIKSPKSNPRVHHSTPRYRQSRGRANLPPETEGLIRPGKVAEILHRFSSTNRGAIRSVYYDSNSDDEVFGINSIDQSASDKIKNRTSNRTAGSSQLEDGIDHLSLMLDVTLDDLDYASG